MGKKTDKNFEPIRASKKGKNLNKEYDKKRDRYFRTKRDAKKGINDLTNSHKDNDDYGD